MTPRQSFRYSIVLPVRNGGEYVKDCVQTILRQNFPDFNLHVLDNSSDDGTLNWLQGLKDDRIVITTAATPLSMEENWARIKTIPRNEFMTTIGHDDLLEENYLATMDKLITEYPDASLYQAHFRFIDSKGKLMHRCKPMDTKQDAAAFLKAIFRDEMDTMGTGYMMRSSDYDRIGGIPAFPNLLFADHALWINLTALGYKITTKEELFSFRLHQSVSKRSVAVKYIRAFFLFMDYLEALPRQYPDINQTIKMNIVPYINYYCRSLSHRLLKTPVREREGITVDSMVKKCKAYADMMSPGNSYDPYKQFNIRLAKMIDNNVLLRSIYLLFRKIYKKSIYT